MKKYNINDIQKSIEEYTYGSYEGSPRKYVIRNYEYECDSPNVEVASELIKQLYPNIEKIYFIINNYRKHPMNFSEIFKTKDLGYNYVQDNDQYFILRSLILGLLEASEEKNISLCKAETKEITFNVLEKTFKIKYTITVSEVSERPIYEDRNFDDYKVTCWKKDTINIVNESEISKDAKLLESKESSIINKNLTFQVKI